MSLALLALLALIAVIVLSAIRTDLNTGVLAVALAFVVGVYAAGLSVGAVAAFLPEQLVLTLVGMSLLFGMAQTNGTLDRLAPVALRLARGRPALLPLIFFGLTFGLSAIGPGNIAATALIAPIAMAVAVRSGLSPLVMAIMVCTGANAGAFSPVALTGLINIGLMHNIGISDPVVGNRIFWSVAGLQSVSALAAYVVFAGYRVRGVPVTDASAACLPSLPLQRQHLVTLAAIALLVTCVIVFNVAPVVGAFVLAGALALLKVGDAEGSLQNLPWGVVSLVAGISVLVGLLEQTGGLDLATSALATVSTAGTVNAALAFVTGITSIYSSSSGVVMPAFVPLLPGLIEKLGGGSLVEMLVAVDVGSHLVDVSPLSTLGALCLAALPASVNKQSLFRPLLLWGLSMSVAGAVLAYVFLDLV
jgi:Na+/H+ antiporter NhaD/arsenite permease-like protein